MNSEQKKKRMIIVSGIAFVVVVVVISVIMLLLQWVEQRKEKVFVVNYPSSLPGNLRNGLEEQLMNVLSMSVDVNKDSFIDGVIRDGTYEELADGGIYSASFILDIDQYKQTYEVNVSWSDKEELPNPVLVSCPDEKLMKYPETECVGMYNSTQLLKEESENPISKILPIKVDEYNAETGEVVRYDIRGYFDSENGDKFNINIIDYSCDNRERALQLIRDKGFNPDDYEIKVYDECYKKWLPYIGTNSMGNRYRVSLVATAEGKPFFAINNYSCNKGKRVETEEASVKAVEDWLLGRGINLSNFEYGVMTLCND